MAMNLKIFLNDFARCQQLSNKLWGSPEIICTFWQLRKRYSFSKNRDKNSKCFLNIEQIGGACGVSSSLLAFVMGKKE
jgi:hypothetical protein